MTASRSPNTIGATVSADVPRGAVQRDIISAPLREPLRQDAQRRRVPYGPGGGGKSQRYHDDVVVGKDPDDQVPEPHQANACSQYGASQVLDAVRDDAAAHRGDAAADATRGLHHADANRADAQGLHHEGQQHQETARIHMLHRVGGNECPGDKEVALAALGPGFLLKRYGLSDIRLGHSSLRGTSVQAKTTAHLNALMLRVRARGCQGGVGVERPFALQFPSRRTVTGCGHTGAPQTRIPTR